MVNNQIVLGDLLHGLLL